MQYLLHPTQILQSCGLLVCGFGVWFFFFEFFGLGVERGLYVLFSHRFFVTPILQRHLDRVKYRDD